MPWRRRPTPYAVWVSEVMLQQTQVETVIPYFDRFIARFPDIHALASAPQQAVLKAWEGLGYYSRARNLHRAAQCIVKDHAGALPRSTGGLAALPGIGAYTAAAIASICWNQPVPVVDGNVLRVCSRLMCIEEPVTRAAVHRRIVTFLTPWIERSGRPGDFNQSIMELGALVCRPRNPDCADCPLRRGCLARQRGCQTLLPVKGPPRTIPHVHEVAVLVQRGNRVLLRHRDDTGMLAGLWELPGGRLERGESAAEGAVRLLAAETGLQVRLSQECGTIDHVYSHFRTTIHVFEALKFNGRLPRGSADRLHWTGPRARALYPLPTAQQRALALALRTA